MNLIKYIKGDLFTTDCKVLMQCISADFGMGRGIAVDFVRNYKVMQFIKQGAWLNNNNLIKTIWPSCFIVKDIETDTLIINLITKEKYSDKPTQKSMYEALFTASNYIVQQDIKEISLPRIGSGLDKLNWEDTESNLYHVFKQNDDLQLNVYYQ